MFLPKEADKKESFICLYLMELSCFFLALFEILPFLHFIFRLLQVHNRLPVSSGHVEKNFLVLEESKTTAEHHYYVVPNVKKITLFTIIFW